MLQQKQSLVNQSTKLAQQRLYVNSFTQRVIGDDVQYTVDLGRPFEIRTSIQLDQCILENLFGNFYMSQKGDFRDLTFIDQTGAYIKIFVDQYISSTQQLAQFLTAAEQDSTSGVWSVIPSVAYEYTVTLNRKVGGVDAPWIPFGYGWNKVGINQQPIGTEAKTTWQGTNVCDLSAPSAFLISIDNIPFSISSGRGSAAFCIPNNSQFGSKNIYTNTQQSTCQTIYVQNPITVSQLNISIQGCDQMVLNTVRARNESINQTNSEHIFVMTIQ